jgi:2'-5' RNA ligase
MLFPLASALGIIPPSDVCDSIDVWRRRYDRFSANFPPHITLTYPPFLPEERWPVFSLELAECLAGFEPFEVILEGVGAFPGIPMGLWLLPRDDGSLARLRAALESSFPQYVEPLPFTFTPHVTVGTFEEQKPLEAARAALEAAWQPLRFSVDRIFFIVQQPGGRWQMKDFLRLGKPA